jgi:hypothetical protein
MKAKMDKKFYTFKVNKVDDKGLAYFTIISTSEYKATRCALMLNPDAELVNVSDNVNQKEKQDPYFDGV